MTDSDPLNPPQPTQYYETNDDYPDYLVKYTTDACVVCGKRQTLELSAQRLGAWKNGVLIDNAFPDMDASTRELIKTGIHDPCWDALL